MPLRSTGCATCRKRKVRCDETRPQCKKCTTHRVICPGYRQDDEGMNPFRDETDTIIRRVKRIHGVESKGGLLKTSSASDERSNSGSALQTETIMDMVKFASDSISTSFDLTFRSPDIERQQVYNKFMQLYLPQSSTWTPVDHSRFIKNVAVARSDNSIMRHSMDALSLVQVGSTYNDQRLLNQAVAAYGRALNSVARDLSKGNSLNDDELMVGITLLTTCELYGNIAILGGWLRHMEGVTRIVQARGPEGIYSETSLLLYSTLRHTVLTHALIARKAPFMADPEWRAVGWRLPPYLQDGSVVFYDAAILVPGFLERFDKLDLNCEDALSEIVALLDEMNRVEENLRAWYSEREALARATSQPWCEPRPIDEFPTFTSLCSDRTFETAFIFPDFFVAYLAAMYWLCLFNLRSTAQELHKLRRMLDEKWLPSEGETITEDEILEYVLNLCRAIPFFCEPISGAAGDVAIFLPMRTAAFYFVYHGHWKWLRWVSAMRDSVFVNGPAPPDVNRPKAATASLKVAMMHSRPSQSDTSG